MSRPLSLFSPEPLSEIFVNPRARPGSYQFPVDHPLARQRVLEAKAVVTGFPGYTETPLERLDKASLKARVSAIYYKDESKRYHLKNFKALGGAYAVLKMVEQEGRDITITSSTAGSHGRAIAWGAQMAGCKCVIFIAEGVSSGREAGMTALGAKVIRVPGLYEESFQAAREAARKPGWRMVCDTTFPGYNDIPLTIMQGYGVLAEEISGQCQKDYGHALQDLTHVFLQAGCGGFAASQMAAILNLCPDKRPKFILVEPEKAACVLKSMEAGDPVYLKGDIKTLMGGLEVAEVSLAAWPVMQGFGDAVLTIRDDAVAPAMAALARGDLGAHPIEAGESAPAGLIAALAAASDEGFRKTLGITDASKILTIGTEGAADPETFETLTGIKPFVGVKNAS